MFALSNLIQQAVQTAISIHSPDMSVLLHVEDVPTPSSAAPTNQRTSLSRESGHSEVEGMDSRPPSREDRRELQNELRGIHHDNDNLLEQLVQSEKELNEVLKSSLARTLRLKELYAYRHTYPPTSVPGKLILPTNHYSRINDDLVQWLKSLDVDERSIRAILSEGYSKIDVLEFVSREELLNIGVRYPPPFF